MVGRAPGSGTICQPTPAVRFLHVTTGAQAGYSLSEFLTVFAMVAILTALTIPIGLSYLRSSTTLEGARDLRARLNQARMLAVTSRQPICVQFTTVGYQFRQATCAGPVIANATTGPNGVVGYAEPVQVTGVSPVFTQFGNATQSTVLTVTGPSGSATTVSVSLSGRVSIP